MNSDKPASQNPYEPPESDSPALFPWKRVWPASAAFCVVCFVVALSLRPLSNQASVEIVQKVFAGGFFLSFVLALFAYLAKRRQDLFFR